MQINNLMDKLVAEKQENCDHPYQYRRVVEKTTVKTLDGLVTIPGKIICDNCGLEKIK